jgi:hypothetical protein
LLLALLPGIPPLSSLADPALPEEISSAALRVTVHAEDGSLRVTDLRNQRTWHQAWVETDPALRQRLVAFDPAQNQITLECNLAGTQENGKPAPAPAQIRIRLSPDRPDLEMTVEIPKNNPWRRAAYPYVFVRDGSDTFNLYPHCEGMLVPVRKTHADWIALPEGAHYGGVHSYLMCLGLVDEPSGEGLLTLLPEIESTQIRWRDVAREAQTVVAPQYIVNANQGRFDRPWHATFSFSDKGGYVALAKRYREFFAAEGLRKTLTEKAAPNPAVRNIAGAPIFWAAASQPEETGAMADILKANGIDRCLFAMANVPWRKPEPEYQARMASTLLHIRSLGYETYRYDQYRDAFEPNPDKPRSHQINTEAWPDKIVRRPDGTAVAAFGPGSGVVCPHFFMPLATRAFDREFGEFAYSAWFLDCLGSVGFNAESECHDPAHPCDRYFARRQREALLAEVNRRGKLAATECGMDYLIPYVHWFEGASTLVRWVDSIDPKQVTENAGINDASGSKRPSVLSDLAKLEPTASPARTISVSTRYRIPFYSLCHHDEAIVTWRWEDGMDHPPVYWQWKNLWSVLYGTPPMYRISAPRLKQFQKEIGQTQRYVSDWVREVAFDALTDHRFVTPDRVVQETEFSSGRGVVANFGDADFKLADGQVVKARDYVTFRKTGDNRAYSAPPCPNVFQ